MSIELIEESIFVPLPLGGVRGGCEAGRGIDLLPNPLPKGKGDKTK